MPLTFTAIDFETANHLPESACAVAAVRVERGRVVSRWSELLRPPAHARRFAFTGLHGIAWRDVARAPTFADAWPTLRALCEGVEFVAAHNAPFDREVLAASCRWWRVRPLAGARFTCTVELARRTWRIYPTRLPCVAEFLGLPLDHHDAASDAEACAAIVLRAHAAGALR